MMYIGQCKGPFSTQEDIGAKIIQQLESCGYNAPFKIGIISRPNHIVTINNIDFEIGKTGMLEFRDTPVSSIVFQQDEDLNTYIDYMAKLI